MTTTSATPAEDRPPVETTACRSCGAPIWFGLTKNQKPCPFDVVRDDATGAMVATDVSHFTTCNDPKRWTKKRSGVAR